MEIKAFGDTVRIALPDPENVNIAITQDAKEVCPLPSAVTPTEKTLKIDNIATFAFKFTDVEQVQSQFNMLDGYGALSMQKLGDKKDKQVMVKLLNDTRVETIGTAAAPQTVTKDNIYDTIIDTRVKLMTKGALNGEGFYTFQGNQEEAEVLAPVLTVDPTIYGLMVKSTQLTHPTVAGDNVVKSAQQAMMGGFEIDVNTVLTDIKATDVANLAEGAHIAIAATKMAITYASQLSKVEKLRDPDCFADIVRGLELYGFLVVHPECAVNLYLTV